MELEWKEALGISDVCCFVLFCFYNDHLSQIASPSHCGKKKRREMKQKEKLQPMTT